ncbi:NAD(P)/FAD-dependent oxidoreductase, partial [Mycobacterium tuberculosis]|nr:NAD(P)/FAD-dependent oxidoreductase [Mycobacterium tuberculosis]
AWLSDTELTPFYASNVGMCRPMSQPWSAHLHRDFGQALKRVKAQVTLPDGKIEQGFGDIILTHYGMESGLIYRLNRAMREQLNHTGKVSLQRELLPDGAGEKWL